MQPQPLDETIVNAFVQQLTGAETPRLLDTWEANDRTAHSAEEFEAIRRILVQRNVLIPPQRNAANASWTPQAYSQPVKKKTAVMTWVIIGLVVLGLCLLCGGGGALLYFYSDELGLGNLLGGAEPTAQPTIVVNAATVVPLQPTAVQQGNAPTAVPPVQPTAVPPADFSAWQVLLTDDFSRNVNGWPEGEGEANDYMDNEWEFDNGQLKWHVTAKDTNLYWMAWPELQEVSDFYVSLDVQKAEGPTSNDLGLFFRQAGDGDFYTFNLNDSTGEYSIYLVDADDWTALVDWTSSTAVRIGRVNKLAVAAQGDRLRFYINDRLVEDLTDGTFTSGSLGITISTYDVNDVATFTFDNLDVRVP